MVKAFPGEDIDLRWIPFHMIEEYARHCGHADLLRETLDGSTGYWAGPAPDGPLTVLCRDGLS